MAKTYKLNKGSVYHTMGATGPVTIEPDSDGNYTTDDPEEQALLETTFGASTQTETRSPKADTPKVDEKEKN